MGGELPADLDILHHAAIDLRAERPDLAATSPVNIVSRLRAMTPLIERAGCIPVQIGQAGIIAFGQL